MHRCVFFTCAAVAVAGWGIAAVRPEVGKGAGLPGIEAGRGGGAGTQQAAVLP